MEMETQQRMPEAHSIKRSLPVDPEFYSNNHDMEEPISYAIMAKKEQTVSFVMGMETQERMPEAHSIKRNPSVDSEFYSNNHDMEEPISYAIMAKKEQANRPFQLTEDMYMEHAIDLKIDPSSHEESGDLTLDLSSNDDLMTNGDYKCASSPAVANSDLNAGNLTLWRFLLDLLVSGRHQEIIQWTSARGEFMLLQAEEVARLWGLRKNKNHRMTYDKLSRALRYYYQKNIIQKVHGHKFVYRFVNLSDGVLQTCRMSMRDKIPFDLSMPSSNGVHHPYRPSFSSPLGMKGEPRSLLTRYHDRLQGDVALDASHIKQERPSDSPHLSSPGVEGSLSSGGNGGRLSPLPQPPQASSVSSSSSPASDTPNLRPCRCHHSCRQLLPEQRSVGCQTGQDTCTLSPLPAFLPPPSPPTPVTTSPKLETPEREPEVGGIRTLQKGLHSVNMQKFAQCIQLQTVPTAREVMSQLSSPSPSPSASRHRHPVTPYSKPPTHRRSTHLSSPWALDQHGPLHGTPQRVKSVSPPPTDTSIRHPSFSGFPVPPPRFPPPAGASIPALVPPSSSSPASSNSSSSSFVWVPVHVNMLRLGQHMSAAAAAAATETSPTHAAAMKNFYV